MKELANGPTAGLKPNHLFRAVTITLASLVFAGSVLAQRESNVPKTPEKWAKQYIQQQQDQAAQPTADPRERVQEASTEKRAKKLTAKDRQQGRQTRTQRK